MTGSLMFAALHLTLIPRFLTWPVGIVPTDFQLFDLGQARRA